MDAMTTVRPPVGSASGGRFRAALERSQQLRVLAALDDRLLREIGLTRGIFARRTRRCPSWE